MIKPNTVEMKSFRPWTKADSTLSDSHFAERLSKSRANSVCSEQLPRLTEENVCCPNFQNTSLVGNFGPQIWLPDSHFGQCRAIGPMELLRPGMYHETDLDSFRTLWVKDWLTGVAQYVLILLEIVYLWREEYNAFYRTAFYSVKNGQRF